METACRLKEKNITIFPFFFQVHAHGHSEQVTGWKIDPNGKWTLLGKEGRSQLSLMQPIREGISLQKGDFVAARCAMNNTIGAKDVGISYADGSEMCNL